MRKSKKLLIAFIAVAMLISLMPTGAFAMTVKATKVTDIKAGNSFCATTTKNGLNYFRMTDCCNLSGDGAHVTGTATIYKYQNGKWVLKKSNVKFDTDNTKKLFWANVTKGVKYKIKINKSKFYDPFEGEFGKLKLNADFPVGMKFSK